MAVVVRRCVAGWMSALLRSTRAVCSGELSLPYGMSVVVVVVERSCTEGWLSALLRSTAGLSVVVS